MSYAGRYMAEWCEEHNLPQPDCAHMHADDDEDAAIASQRRTLEEIDALIAVKLQYRSAMPAHASLESCFQLEDRLAELRAERVRLES